MSIVLVIFLLTSCGSGERVKENLNGDSDPYAEMQPTFKYGAFTPSSPNHWPETIPLPWDMVVALSYYQAPLERLETIFSRRDESTPTPSLEEIREFYLKELPGEWEQVDAPPLAFNKGSLRLSFTRDDESLDLYGLELSDNHDVHLTVIYSSKGDIKLPIDLGLMPKDWPEDIPLMPAMKLYSGKTDAIGRKMVTLLGRDDPKPVLSYYKKNLSNWELDSIRHRESHIHIHTDRIILHNFTTRYRDKEGWRIYMGNNNVELYKIIFYIPGGTFFESSRKGWSSQIISRTLYSRLFAVTPDCLSVGGFMQPPF